MSTHATVLCAYNNTPGCAADYASQLVLTPSWEVTVGIVGMFFMAFATGANNIGNTMANLVGCKVLPIRQALIIGGLADFLGAISLGFSFKDAIATKVGSLLEDQGSPTGSCWQQGYTNSLQYEYANGMFAALFAGASFVLIATACKMPVSATHSVICGVIGMTLLNVGSDCFNLSVLNGIFSVVLSWVLGPLFAGIVSVLAYHLTNRAIINSSSPRQRALMFLPLFYALGIFSVSVIIFSKSRILTGISDSPALNDNLLVISVAAGAGLALIVAGIVSVFLVPHVRGLCPSFAKAAEMQTEAKLPTVSPFAPCTELGVREYTALTSLQFSNLMHIRDDYVCTLGDDQINAVGRTSMELIADAYCLTDEQIDAHFAMKYALLFASILGSFLHGATDVGNSTIPMQILYTVSRDAYTTGPNDVQVPNAFSSWDAPYWLFVIAGVGGFLGINLFGKPVMDTMARGLSIVNVHRGFCMEMGTIVTLALANVLRLPVSSTYCAVSSVVCVSLAHYGTQHLERKRLGFVVLTWILTLPVTMGLSAGLSAIMNSALKK
ncbi:inorganic phosphate transporter [Achlya hypogyna]|uniref:Phosphate transporter n=1 Tax=Achlya hypogyna TaxID=1202772 RepID=A0A1V9ZFC6_ACHHY|nr:inorganic phosphate transporter [Achlya hypogyna]